MKGLAATIGIVLLCVEGCGPDEEWPREERQRFSNVQVQRVPRGVAPESATPSEGRRVTFLGKEFVQRKSISFDSFLSQDFFLPDDTEKQWSEKISIILTSRDKSHEASPQLSADIIRTADPEAYTRLESDDGRQRTVLVFARLRSSETLESGVTVSRFSDDGSASIIEEYWRRQAAPESGVISDDIRLALDELKERVLKEQFPEGVWPPGYPDRAMNEGPMPVYVTPYYDSKGPMIHTGKFDRELLAVDSQSMDALLEDMEVVWSSLPVETMFVTAIRLYDNNRNKDAAFWLFAALIRARLFESVAIGTDVLQLSSPSFRRRSAHVSFARLAGSFIVRRFSSDREGMESMIERAIARSRVPPDFTAMYPKIEFIERSQWQSELDRILQDFKAQIQGVKARDEE